MVLICYRNIPTPFGFGDLFVFLRILWCLVSESNKNFQMKRKIMQDVNLALPLVVIRNSLNYHFRNISNL